jgi:hypothetical protein
LARRCTHPSWADGTNYPYDGAITGELVSRQVASASEKPFRDTGRGSETHVEALANPTRATYVPVTDKVLGIRSIQFRFRPGSRIFIDVARLPQSEDFDHGGILAIIEHQLSTQSVRSLGKEFYRDSRHLQFASSPTGKGNCNFGFSGGDRGLAIGEKLDRP